MMRRLLSRVLAQSTQNGFLCNEAVKPGPVEFIGISSIKEKADRQQIHIELHFAASSNIALGDVNCGTRH